MLQEMRSQIVELREQPRAPRFHPGVIEELMTLLSGFQSICDTEDLSQLTKEQLDEIRMRLRHSDRLVHHLCMEAGFPPDFAMRRMFRYRERPAKPTKGEQ